MPSVESQTVPLLTDESPDDANHAPHLASDHSLRLVSQVQTSPATFVFCMAAATFEVFRPQFLLPLFLSERQNPPGLPPPDPLQPRAPPIA
jgi:hypothetical protein